MEALAARKRQGARMQPVMDLVPEPRPLERPLDQCLHILAVPASVDPQPRRHVVEDGHGGEGRGALKDHADPPPELDRVHLGRVHVVLVEQHAAGDRCPLGKLVHPVEAAEKGALAATGGSDDGGDAVERKSQRHMAHRGVAVEVGREELGPKVNGPFSGHGRTGNGWRNGRPVRTAGPAP